MTETTASSILGGIVQMGARVYIPTLGRFLQVDPVEGGTDNNYAYANDPVNQFDLDGEAIPLVFIAVNLARMAAPHVARAAVKYIAKPAVTYVTKKTIPFLAQKAVPQMAKWGTNLGARGKAAIPKIHVQVKKSGPDHWWPNKNGVNGKGWYKHLELNVRVINRATNKTTHFIHKQLPYGKAYKYKYGRGGIRL